MQVKKVVQLNQFRKAKEAKTKLEQLREDAENFPSLKKEIEAFLDLHQRYELWKEEKHTIDHPMNPLGREIQEAQRMNQHIKCLADFAKSTVREAYRNIQQKKHQLQSQNEAHAHTS